MATRNTNSHREPSRRRVFRCVPALAMLLALALAPMAAVAQVVTPLANSCIDNDTKRANVCTAKDVDIAMIEVLEIFDGCTGAGDTARISAVMDYVSNATERYDIGSYFAADGGNARLGTCYHNWLQPPLVASPNHRPRTGIGPYLNAETSSSPPDLCGDIRSRDGLTRHSVDAFYGSTGAMEVSCTDTDGNGLLDIGYCTFWDNNASSLCLGHDQAMPGTSSKCRCGRINLDVTVPPPTGVSTAATLPLLGYADCAAAGNNLEFQLHVHTGCTNLQITSATNNVVGDLNGRGTCAFPQTLTQGGDYECGFPVRVTTATTFTTTVQATCDGKPVTLVASSSAECLIESTACDSDAMCDDGLYCDGTESCSGGLCQPSTGNPCPTGACSACQETGDNCIAPAGAVCRAAASVCDVAETCSGTSSTCPADTVAPSGTVCRAVAGVCDVAESCNGASGACPADGYLSSATTCRTASGVCDLAETCTGSAAACPADAFRASTVTCRAASGVCDADERCTGSSAACPADAFAASTTVCRVSSGVCDAAERCTGASASCPADAFASSATVCRAASGLCDVDERCTGASAACPADAFASTATVCRAPAGVCDVAENCSGASGACPADAFASASSVCRATAGVCDVAENCSGAAAACPADAFASGATTCRDAAGVCDTPEACSGASATCPADTFQGSSTVCRATNGVCDAEERCSGAAAACPADAFASSATTCRASAGECDAAEACSGSAAACPADVAAAAGTPCGDPTATPCDLADVCNSSGQCIDNLASTAVICRPADGECDVHEHCDGAGACDDDEVKPDGTVCGNPDSSACDLPDTCADGVCESNEVCEACLEMVKSARGTFSPGATVTYTIHWSNTCEDDLTGLVVTDALPAGLEPVSVASADAVASLAGSVARFDVGDLPGLSNGHATVTVRVSAAATSGTRIENRAIGSADDGYWADAHHFATVRDATQACPVSLRKVHSGNAAPGAEVQYSLQWSNGCRDDLADVTVVDPLPAGMSVVAAESPDASVTIDGDTVTFHHALFAAGSVGTGFVTARLDADLPNGTLLRNVATLEDGSGHTAEAVNSMRVRTDDVADGALACFVRAQVYARPGRYVKYEVRYKNGSTDNELTLVLPDEVDIVRAYPEPTWIDGHTLYWATLAATAGKATVNTIVDPLAEDGLPLESSAFMDDRDVETAVCEHHGVVSRMEKLFASIKAPTYAREGTVLRYVARYREAVGHDAMTVSLPAEVTVKSVSPAPTDGTGNTLSWVDLAVPAGVVKIDAVVGHVPDGAVLAASMLMSDESGALVGSETRTTVTPSTIGGGTSTGPAALSLTALRAVSAGTTTDIGVRYGGAAAPAALVLTLPDAMEAVMAVPAATIDGSTVTWTGLATSGALKLRVAVAGDAAVGTVLPVAAVLTGADGVTGSAAASTVVR